MHHARLMGRLAVLALLALGACDREGAVPAEDEAPLDELALPPSASAPRRSLPGGVPDTVTVDERTPVVRDLPGPDETVGPVPPAVLDIGTIVNAYHRYYVALFHEMGSDVRNDVDPRLVEDAKRRTALDFGFVQAGAWNQMVRELSAAQRTSLAERVAATNQDLAIELHGRPPR